VPWPDYYHVPIVGQPHKLPGVHRAAALVKRWLLSTHQGFVDPVHLPDYLNVSSSASTAAQAGEDACSSCGCWNWRSPTSAVRYRDLVRTGGQSQYEGDRHGRLADRPANW
jgi:hypothetical protein